MLITWKTLTSELDCVIFMESFGISVFFCIGTDSNDSLSSGSYKRGDIDYDV